MIECRAVERSGAVQTLPSYADLPQVGNADERCAWSVWGDGDELGAVNLLTPDRVVAAARLVETGEVVTLSLPLDEPRPGLFPNRRPYSRHEEVTPLGRDDHVTDLYLQASSQWDGLRHIRHRSAGYYGGRTDADVDQGALGIDVWARHGIIARGVLIDLPEHYARRGQDYRPDQRVVVDGATIEAVARDQGVSIERGDVLLLRTGWIDWYLALDAEQREALVGTVGPGGLATPGLDGRVDMAAWLWDHGIVGVAADNPAVEVLPVDREAGFLHRRLIPLLGMALGEFWALRELAQRCATAARYEFLLVSAPLNLPAGVGSPANAYAVL